MAYGRQHAFFLFFMVGFMKTMIGADYERGLKTLTEYVETGGVNSKTKVAGIDDVSQTHYIGVEARCSVKEIGDSMGQSLPAAFECAKKNGMEQNGPPGTLYHKVDLKQQQCHYTAFVQTKTAPTFDGAQAGSIAPCRALKVLHTSSYQHFGNAWSTAMAYQRHRKLQLLKSQCGFELYPSDPRDTAEKDLITEVFLPVRS